MDRFLIAPFETGTQLDLPPWQIMDDAFTTLNNAYVFRGRIKKRFGSQLIGSSQLTSRVRLNLGNTDPMTGNITKTVPGSVFKIGQMFSIGTEIFTVYQTGNPAVMLDTGASTVHTYSTTTGQVIITGAAPNTALYFYPAEPIMGLTNYEVGEFNNEPSYAFDTQFAYLFTGGAWTQSGTYVSPTEIPTWHGSNLDFFWSDNWRGVTPDLKIMFVTNFHAHIGLGLVTDDPIWSLNNTTWTPLSYSPDALQNPTNSQPFTVTSTTAGNNQIIANYVETCRIIVQFKGRLLLLNTIENNANGATATDPMNPTTTGITPANYLTSTNTAYTNRCRYSFIGSPFASNAWLEANQTYNPGATGVVVAAGAGAIDAPTDDQILSAEFIKDRLIVFFDRSTWEIVYTGNQLEPFVWQKINTELGSQGPMSTVPFDKVVLTLGNQGVHACNGSNVERIDSKIPNIIFDVQQQNLQPTRIAGIRDYFSEMVYWSTPVTAQQSNQTYPGYVFTYNYRNNSWAFNQDCITAFGYFNQQPALTWATATNPWDEYDQEWDAQNNAQFRSVLAGNQEGFTFLCRDDFNSNAYAMQITNIVTVGADTVLKIIDNTLLPFDYLQITGVQGATGLNGNIYAASPVSGSTTDVLIEQWDNVNKIFIPVVFGGVYTGGGTVARVSQIFIKSKQWNPYVSQDRGFQLAKIDFGVLRTSASELTIDYYSSSGQLALLEEAEQTGTLMGTGVLETFAYPSIPFEQQQTLLWHPVYLQSQGTNMQIQIFMNPHQQTTPAIVNSPMEIQGMVLYTQPTSSRLQ